MGGGGGVFNGTCGLECCASAMEAITSLPHLKSMNIADNTAYYRLGFYFFLHNGMNVLSVTTLTDIP